MKNLMRQRQQLSEIVGSLTDLMRRIFNVRRVAMHSPTKLTLRIDKKLISFAKHYASQSGKSLSQLVAEYFNLLENVVPEKKMPVTPITRSLIGVLRDSRISEKD